MLTTQQKTLSWVQKGFEDDIADAIESVIEVTKNLGPKKR
jgi:hypothetical protein